MESPPPTQQMKIQVQISWVGQSATVIVNDLWAPLKMECHQAKATYNHQTVLNSLQKPLWCHQAAKKSEAVAVNCSGGSGRTGAVISSHYHLSFHFGDRCNFFSIIFLFHVGDSPTMPTSLMWHCHAKWIASIWNFSYSWLQSFAVSCKTLLSWWR